MDEQQQTRTAETAAPGNNARKIGFWKRRPVILIGTLILAALFYFGLEHLIFSFTHETTDNAFLESDVISMAAKVAGQVKAVAVNDNEHVQAGDLLVQIDPRDYEIQLAQKKSALEAAKANQELVKASYELLKIQVDSAKATADQSEATAAADRAKAQKAAADLKRAEDLSDRKIISPQEFDAAKSEAVSAEATLRASEAKAAADKLKVSESQAQMQAGLKAYQRAEAQANESKVDVDQADLNLSYTKVTAPATGRVTRKAVEAGDYIQVGQKLMALVLNDLWVTANFKETQLADIRTNQPVVVTVDSIGGREFPAHVQSVQAGSGAAFSLLPPENAVGNYVKVVQRVPVKIVFDHPLDVQHVLGPGMSVVPAVRTSDFSLPAFVIAIAAAIVALVIGWLWWRFASRSAASSRPS